MPRYRRQARKKMPIGLLRNPPSSGRAASERLSLLFLFIIILSSYTVYCLVLHPPTPPHTFLPVSLFFPALYFNSDFVLFFLCCPPTSTCLSPVPSLWGSFGSERRFGARLRQYFTLIKRMVGAQWELHRSRIFPHLVGCGGKEFISFIATLHHHQEQQSVVLLSYFIYLNGFICEPDIDLLSVTPF